MALAPQNALQRSSDIVVKNVCMILCEVLNPQSADSAWGALQQGLLAMYSILVCMGTGITVGSEGSLFAGASAGGKGELRVQRTQGLKPKIEVSRMKICLAQNLDKDLHNGKTSF